jgi:tRNA U34 5-methylaminomethyl-2-thiouridine-forming methyltransferase MnmC
METKIILTKDNSPTIFNETLNATYHSINGALQESMHVFINNGLLNIISQHSELNILEVGMGTGLNVLLSIIESQKFFDKIFNYLAVEKYPLSTSKIKELSNYLPFKDFKNIFYQIHSNNKEEFFENFKLIKFYEDVNLTLNKIEDESIHLVYYDAFAPSSQPEMWNKEIFEKLFLKMKSKGVLVTFCAKGEFKRILKSIGFVVDSLPGANSKREMTRAIKP